MFEGPGGGSGVDPESTQGECHMPVRGGMATAGHHPPLMHSSPSTVREQGFHRESSFLLCTRGSGGGHSRICPTCSPNAGKSYGPKHPPQTRIRMRDGRENSMEKQRDHLRINHPTWCRKAPFSSAQVAGRIMEKWCVAALRESVFNHLGTSMTDWIK